MKDVSPELMLLRFSAEIRPQLLRHWWRPILVLAQITDRWGLVLHAEILLEITSICLLSRGSQQGFQGCCHTTEHRHKTDLACTGACCCSHTPLMRHCHRLQTRIQTSLGCQSLVHQTPSWTDLPLAGRLGGYPSPEERLAAMWASLRPCILSEQHCKVTK